MKTQKLPVILLEGTYLRIRNLIQSNGISIISNIIIIWDEQYDSRLLNILVNEITKKERNKLLLICQDGNYLYSIWNKVPKRFRNDKLFLKKFNCEQYAYTTNDNVGIGGTKNE